MADSDDGDFSASSEDWNPGAEDVPSESDSSESESSSDDFVPVAKYAKAKVPTLPNRLPNMHRSQKRANITPPANKLSYYVTEVMEPVKQSYESESSSEEEDSSPSKSTNTSNEIMSKTNSEPNISSYELESYSAGDHLQNANSLNFNSSFNESKPESKVPDFTAIENNIMAGVDRLSESESSEFEDVVDEDVHSINLPVETNKELKGDAAPKRLNFQQLHDFTKKLADAKVQLQKYKSKTKRENKLNVQQLLAMGEAQPKKRDTKEDPSDMDSEEGDFEEVKGEIKNPQKSLIPKGGIQITVDLPFAQREKVKKKLDLEAIIKRKMNNIKKQYQIYIHKVHLLCWIAHGNYLNGKLNNASVLAEAVKLIPNKECYPPKLSDIAYLSMILKWYIEKIHCAEEIINKERKTNSPISKMSKPIDLVQSLKDQITKKSANSKRDLILIFIAMLRSVGLHCRLVLSFQTVPLRPPASQLSSLSKTESSQEKMASNSKTKQKPKKRKRPVKVDISPKKKIKKVPKPKVVDVNVDVFKFEKGNVVNPKVLPSATNDIEMVATTSKMNNGEAAMVKSPTPRSKLLDSVATQRESNNNKILVKSTQIRPGREINVLSAKVVLSPRKTRSRTANLAEASKKLANLKIIQLDGADDAPTKRISKPNLSKLKTLKASTANVKEGGSLESERSSMLRKGKTDEAGCSKDTDRKLDRKSAQSPKSSRSPAKKSRNQNSNSTGKTLNTKKKSEDSTVKLESKTVKKIFVKSGKQNTSIEKAESKPRKRHSVHEDYDSESDFQPSPEKKSHVDRIKKRIDRRVLSTDDETVDADVKKKIGDDIWVEVYLESEEKWISVDVPRGQIHCVNLLYARATHPVTYIVAWDNDNHLKDITKRYCPQWATVTRKLRVDPTWWEQTLRPWLGDRKLRDRQEDEDLYRMHLDKPLPTSINEYKNHPLYALKRHLLKFEAIYPPDAMTLGFCKSEEVYSRDCVHTLHSRETWVKQARVVKPAQQPYKIVKARPKWDRIGQKMITDIPLEVFGKWQTKDYEPPVAENGVVPRNPYGNVELFKECMLPIGTVHLRLVGLNKVARKLQIDCAPAMTGFDFHGGSSHPVYDGYVVCAEFKDTIVDAWHQEQEEIEKRAIEKIEKRVYGNWRRLIKGLWIRERLKARYNFENEPSIEEPEKKKPSKSVKRSTKKR